jgi:hypothetical protein
MIYLPPFWVPGTHKLPQADIKIYAAQYNQLLTMLKEEAFSEEEMMSVPYLNALITTDKTY